MTKWIDTNNQIPPPMHRVLCWWTWPGRDDRYQHYHGIGYHTGDHMGWRSANGKESWTVTHWTTLPDGPILHAKSAGDPASVIRKNHD